MKRVIEDSSEARIFLEGLGVKFNRDSTPVFPPEPKENTAQDMTLNVMKLALAICEQERPLAGIVPPIGAIVTVSRKPQPGRDINGKFSSDDNHAPSLVSQFTAQLGPCIHLFQRGKIGKLYRAFATYNIDHKSQEHIFDYWRNAFGLAGLRVLYVVDHHGLHERNFDMIERIAKVVLAHKIQGDHLRLTLEEQAELDHIEDEKERALATTEYIAQKRSFLTAGIASLVSTEDDDILAEQASFRLGFRVQQLYTLYNNSPPKPKDPKPEARVEASKIG